MSHTIMVWHDEACGWCADDGVTGQDGYSSRLAAAYAARIRGWGGAYPTPQNADEAIKNGWRQ
jgi:hypothetical protein